LLDNSFAKVADEKKVGRAKVLKRLAASGVSRGPSKEALVGK
jgi:hypothetical protein